MDESGERHHLAVLSLRVEKIEGVGTAFEFGRHFEDDVIVVELGEILGHLALAESIVENVIDLLRLDAVARRLVTVDDEAHRRARHLLVGGDVTQERDLAKPRQNLGGPRIELAEIRVLERVLIHGAGEPSAHPDVLRRLQVKTHPGHLGEFGPQFLDHLGCGQFTFAPGLE